jgi:signal transduction histidine kinase
MRDGLATLLAHDLKTPLAAISMNLDFVLSELPSDVMPAAMRAALDDCRCANQRAIRILSDMADAVRLQSGERRPCLGEFNVQTVLSVVVRNAAAEAAARGVCVVWTADAQTLKCDEELLGRALDRLLERALRHARAGGTIDLVHRDGKIVIRVRSAVTEESAGSPAESTVRGLAMHFAEAAMRAQGGAVWTEGDGDGSLLFCIALPA